MEERKLFISAQPLKPYFFYRGGPIFIVIFLGIDWDAEEGSQEQHEDQGFKRDFYRCFLFPKIDEPKDKGPINLDFIEKEIIIVRGAQTKRDGQGQEGNSV